jgi:hypothetical protein
MKPLLALILLATPVAAADVPSAQEVTLHEVLIDVQADATWLRFRYLTPQIAAGDAQISFEIASDDMMHLCQTFALPYLVEHTLSPDKIVVSFMDRITEFGQPDPDAIQYFEAFRPEDGVCIWDEF